MSYVPFVFMFSFVYDSRHSCGDGMIVMSLVVRIVYVSKCI